MVDNIFQKCYNWFKNLSTPEWLIRFFNKVQTIAVDVLKVLGEEAIQHLQNSIIEQSRKDIPNVEKLQNVVNDFKETFTIPYITDSMLNLAIELILQELKQDEVI